MPDLCVLHLDFQTTKVLGTFSFDLTHFQVWRRLKGDPLPQNKQLKEALIKKQNKRIMQHFSDASVLHLLQPGYATKPCEYQEIRF